MKKYMKLLMVALFATLSFTLVSCGDDDDDDASALVGTWTSSWEEDGISVKAEVTFKNNGTFHSEGTYSYGGYSETYTSDGTYTVEGDPKDGAVLYMSGVDSDGEAYSETDYIRIEGKKLIVTDEEGEQMVFKKK